MMKYVIALVTTLYVLPVFPQGTPKSSLGLKATELACTKYMIVTEEELSKNLNEGMQYLAIIHRLTGVREDSSDKVCEDFVYNRTEGIFGTYLEDDDENCYFLASTMDKVDIRDEHLVVIFQGLDQEVIACSKDQKS